MNLNQNEKNRVLGKKEKKLLIVVGLLLCVALIVGVSYAWWSYVTSQNSTNIIKSDCLVVELKDETSAIKLEKSYPLTDTEANHLTPYTFTIKNVCNTSIVYDVELDIMESKDSEGNDIRLKSEYIAISFDGGEKKLLHDPEIEDPTKDFYPSVTPKYDKKDFTPAEGRYLTSGTLLANESQSYSIKLWIDEHVTVEDDAMNKEFISKIVVSASLNQIVEDYKEEILNGTDPVLADNLIPVEIDNNGNVTKADLSKAWYSYEEKRWANAVILEDESITYQDGEEIPESNIESYFVWIPKYSYELWDLGEYSSLTAIDTSKVHTIPIKFGTENTSDSNSGECTTPMTSGSSGNCKIGDYMTPPAFISMGTNGLWVGKFETGYKGATSTSSAEINPPFTSSTTEEQIKIYSDKIEIKPNVYSWRNTFLAHQHLVSYYYKRELDSHMMKNTEWGAVAYLQHSQYGSAASVRINNNSAYITGYAAVNEPTADSENDNAYESTNLGVDGANTYNYKNPNSQTASTTGNYTGIYDMSGGSWERVMNIMMNETNSSPLTGRNLPSVHSNFNGILASGEKVTNGIDLPNGKYYDTYQSNASASSFQKRILGDGTSEFGPFGKVSSISLHNVSSWYTTSSTYIHLNNTPELYFHRGGEARTGSESGITCFYQGAGIGHIGTGFRIVLAI